MSVLREWAFEFGVPIHAVVALEHRLRVDGDVAIRTDNPEGSESQAQALVMLEAAHANKYLFRNNVGALMDKQKRLVRYGLANTSEKLNDRLKSADLIGWETVIVTPQWLGKPIARFLSREIKEAAWQYTGTPREVAQLAWANLVNSCGGNAGFATGPGTL